MNYATKILHNPLTWLKPVIKYTKWPCSRYLPGKLELQGKSLPLLLMMGVCVMKHHCFRSWLVIDITNTLAASTLLHHHMNNENIWALEHLPALHRMGIQIWIWHRHFFSISAYRLSVKFCSADIADIVNLIYYIKSSHDMKISAISTYRQSPISVYRHIGKNVICNGMPLQKLPTFVIRACIKWSLEV